MFYTIADVKSAKLSQTGKGLYELSGIIAHHCADETDMNKIYFTTFSITDGNAELNGFGEACINEDTMQAFEKKEGLDVFGLLLSEWADTTASYASKQFLFRAMIQTIARAAMICTAE